MIRVVNDRPEKIFSFVRQKGDDHVLAVFNFSGEAQTVTLSDGPINGTFRDERDGSAVTLREGMTMTLAPWGFRLLSR